MLNRVRTFLAHHNLLREDACIVVAVSGGPDSLCMLHLLWRVCAQAGTALHVAHLDHCFRGAESADEARFVADIACEWHIPATVEQHDVAALVRETGKNKQATAREIRYAFLARVAQAQAADAVAVAHNADDQAETVLLHLLHGAGPAGLRGMRATVPWDIWNPSMVGSSESLPEGTKARPVIPARRGETPDSPLCTGGIGGEKTETMANAKQALLIRPLLTTNRAEIEQYCTTHALIPRQDSSNTSLYYTRNRIRAELLPHMTAYNPHIVAALGRTAQICADDYAYIQAHLDAVWNNGLATKHDDALQFNGAMWRTLPTTLQRYALRRAVMLLVGNEAMSYELVEAGCAATSQPTGYQQPLGQGLLLRVDYDGFVVGHADKLQEQAAPANLHVPQLATDTLPLPDTVTELGTLSIAAGWYATWGLSKPGSLPEGGRWRWWVMLDANAILEPLCFRRRQSGDRFRPAGGRGSRSLQDFFVDHKVPRALRDAWPLLATPTQVVWVAGLRADVCFQATDSTQRVLWVVLWHNGQKKSN